MYAKAFEICAFKPGLMQRNTSSHLVRSKFHHKFNIQSIQTLTLFQRLRRTTWWLVPGVSRNYCCCTMIREVGQNMLANQTQWTIH
ncbi:hypothetical protein FGO68_gene8784 [Halteria grandinella]|uniref:Uncharacterized protein n=1 Tax=Halteria grandinella TaxID=5974 RepID=A0A8J8T9G4_HALGN|nr:hypothetical protein FGO68_gene8784 [Halteria grandinella]